MGYWRTQLEKYKGYLESTGAESLFIESVENSREMRTTYAKLGSIRAFITWLEYKADMEDLGHSSSGAILQSVGGV